jgi:hypothetical protein
MHPDAVSPLLLLLNCLTSRTPCASDRSRHRELRLFASQSPFLGSRQEFRPPVSCHNSNLTAPLSPEVRASISYRNQSFSKYTFTTWLAYWHFCRFYSCLPTNTIRPSGVYALLQNFLAFFGFLHSKAMLLFVRNSNFSLESSLVWVRIWLADSVLDHSGTIFQSPSNIAITWLLPYLARQHLSVDNTSTRTLPAICLSILDLL